MASMPSNKQDVQALMTYIGSEKRLVEEKGFEEKVEKV